MSTTGGNDIESSNAPSNFGAQGLTSRHGARPFTSGEYTSSGSEIPTPAHPLYYKMNHTKRGLALIFNHELFSSGLYPRTGTKVDRDKLTNSLAELGFEVKHYQDFKFEAITTVFAKVAGMDHTDHDCLVVALLTHGGPGILYAQNTPYRADIIWSYFTADKCPTLAGKPKMFFIQACRGDKLDAGVTLRERTETDGHGAQTFRIPSHADFLIAYSTIPGFYSWRNTTDGSWFIQTLCSELGKNGTRWDLLTILTFVCQRVAVDFESDTPGNIFMHQQKQIPCFTSTLTRLVKFTLPKNGVAAD